MYEKYETYRTNPDGIPRRHRDDVPARDCEYHIPRRCRIRDPIDVTDGPPLPRHMVTYSLKVASNMKTGYYRRDLTYLVGIRATDTFTEERAGRIIRGFAHPLGEDCHALLTNKIFMSTGEKPESIFAHVEEWFHLSPSGRYWKLWAFRNMWDDKPREMACIGDVDDFVRNCKYAMKNPELFPVPRQVGEYDGYYNRLVMHFVVEVSRESPKTFAVTYEDEKVDVKEKKKEKEGNMPFAQPFAQPGAVPQPSIRSQRQYPSSMRR